MVRIQQRYMRSSLSASLPLNVCAFLSAPLVFFFFFCCQNAVCLLPTEKKKKKKNTDFVFCSSTTKTVFPKPSSCPGAAWPYLAMAESINHSCSWYLEAGLGIWTGNFPIMRFLFYPVGVYTCWVFLGGGWGSFSHWSTYPAGGEKILTWRYPGSENSCWRETLFWSLQLKSPIGTRSM